MFTAETVDKTAMLQANAIGQCEILEALLEIDAEQLFPQKED